MNLHCFIDSLWAVAAPGRDPGVGRRPRMSRVPACAVAVLIFGCIFGSAPVARAASFSAQISDDTGRPLPFAVVTLTSAAPITVPPAPALMSQYIDQKDETFIPYVVAILRGGTVIFRNSDTTRHHVYTFSPIHPFEFILKPGDISTPQRFDKPGVAAIGCNIHDQMIAYVYVSDTPLTAVSDAGGHAVIAEVPSGNYQMKVWYPQMKPGKSAVSQALTVSNDAISLSVAVPAVPFVAESMDDMNDMN